MTDEQRRVADWLKSGALTALGSVFLWSLTMMLWGSKELTVGLEELVDRDVRPFGEVVAGIDITVSTVDSVVDQSLARSKGFARTLESDTTSPFKSIRRRESLAQLAESLAYAASADSTAISALRALPASPAMAQVISATELVLGYEHPYWMATAGLYGADSGVKRFAIRFQALNVARQRYDVALLGQRNSLAALKQEDASRRARWERLKKKVDEEAASARRRVWIVAVTFLISSTLIQLLLNFAQTGQLWRRGSPSRPSTSLQPGSEDRGTGPTSDTAA